ncbi:MAG: hypothetical protein K0B01_03620 [Syntrophobacterales bacterium]|nr:hypothetical protein [Syntrophobacterales bacterium]
MRRSLTNGSKWPATDVDDAKLGAISLPAQSRFPSSRAALIRATFAGPRPGTFRSSSLWVRSIPSSPRNSFRSERATVCAPSA